MKKLGVAVLLVVVALLALPAVLGVLTESQVKARVAAINGGTWSADLTSYERGWFRSRATLEIKPGAQYASALGAFGAQAPAGAPLTGLPMAIELAHGPVTVLRGVYFGLSQYAARPDHADPRIAALEQRLGVPYLFEFRGRTSFLGRVLFGADAPAIETPIDTGSVRFSGAAFDGTLAGNHVKSQGHVDALEFSSPAGSVTLRGLRFTVDNELRSRYVMPGTAIFTLDSVSLVDAANGAAGLDLTNLRVGTNVAVDPAGTLLDMRTTYDADSVTANGMQVTEASLGLAFRNVDVAVLEAYGDAANRLAAAAPGNPALDEFGPLLQRALATKPTFALEPLHLRVDGEPFEAHLEMTPSAQASAALGQLLLGDPTAWLQLIDGNARVDVSRKLAERMAAFTLRTQMAGDPTVPAEQLDDVATAQSGAILLMLTGQGILTVTGDGYRADVELANGAVMLNGRPMPFGLP